MTSAHETAAQMLMAGMLRGALLRDRPDLGHTEIEQAVITGVKLLNDAGAYLKGGRLHLPATE